MMQNIAMMITIKLTQLRCVLIAQSSNVLIVIRKSILAIEQKNDLQKASLPNLIKNQLGRSIVTAAPAGRDNVDVSMIHLMVGWVVEQNPLILSLHKNKKDGIKQNYPNKNWLLQSRAKRYNSKSANK